MKPKIFPLTITSVNWEIFIKMSQDILGFSPTRGLDEAKMDMKVPASYLACLDFENNPRYNLLHPNSTYSHVSMSFILQTDGYTLGEIASITEFSIISKSSKTYNYLVILTGTVGVWLRAIITGCQNQISKDTRIIFNACMEYFENAGFGPLWSSYQKQILPDGTFILIRT
jgi:hypothetical protein